MKPDEDNADLWRDKKTFRRGHLSRLTQSLGREPKIVEYHLAGDKVSWNRFYYIGDPQELFAELKAEGFSFVD